MEDYTTEYHNIEEFLPHELQQDACWWYEKFGGFEDEMYAILEYSEKQMDDVIVDFLKTNFKARQDKLILRFESGGRECPYDEEISFDFFNYFTTDKVDELDTSGNLPQQ